MLHPQPPINATCDAYHGAALALWRGAIGALPCRLDVPYGDHPEQRLDLFLPAASGDGPYPIFLDIHGGGWTHGYKEWMALAAPAITAFPAVYVSLGYRLAPAARHPAQVEDCLAALGWLIRHATDFGGDAARVHIGGHSAGAQIAALATLRTDLHVAYGLARGAIRSCFGYSGLYDLRGAHLRPVVPGLSPVPMLDSAAAEADASPLMFVQPVETAFHVSWGAQEGAEFREGGRAFADALAAAGNRVTIAVPDLDHFWIHLDHSRPDSDWIAALRRSIAKRGASPWQS